MNTTGFAMLLGQLEQPAMLHSYNFSMPSSNAVMAGSANTVVVGAANGGQAVNTTVVGSLVATLVCPSDVQPVAVSDPTGTSGTQFIRLNAMRANYLLCSGHYADSDSSWAFPRRPMDSGAFLTDASVRLEEIRDGASNTCLVGESPQIHADPSFGPYWGAGCWSSTHGIVLPPTDPNASAYLPNGKPTAALAATVKPTNPPQPPGLPYMSVMGSKHFGGLNMLFADGSVRFLKNSINPTIWYGLQTIRGGEVIGTDSY